MPPRPIRRLRDLVGERDPKVLAQPARGTMRGKVAVLQEGLTGRFDDHHALICRMMLSTIDTLTPKTDELTVSIKGHGEVAELRMERDILKRSVVLWVKEATK